MLYITYGYFLGANPNLNPRACSTDNFTHSVRHAKQCIEILKLGVAKFFKSQVKPRNFGILQIKVIFDHMKVLHFSYILPTILIGFCWYYELEQQKAVHNGVIKGN